MNWHLFVSIYLLIFIAELPDKTAFATLLLATRSRPLPVFAGVALAFLVQTVVALIFGSLIALLPANWVHLAAGLMFFTFAAQMWRGRDESESEAETHAEHDLETAHINLQSLWTSVGSSFLVIFVAEWGDLTQLTTASLAAKYPAEKLTVFLASVLALWSVTLLAVVMGRQAKRFVNPSVIKRYATVLFALIGVYFVLTAVRALLGLSAG